MLLGLQFDNQTDMFSLGVILLEVLLGFNPLQSDSSAELFYRHDKLFSSTYGPFESSWVDKSPLKSEIFEMVDVSHNHCNGDISDNVEYNFAISGKQSHSYSNTNKPSKSKPVQLT